MFILTKTKVRKLLLGIIAVLILHFFGVFTHIFEKDFYSEFHYPYDGDIEEFISILRKNGTPSVQPINYYNFKFMKNPKYKCSEVSQIRLVYLVKSAPKHFARRISIRSAWGYEKRFSDVDIRTVFLIGAIESEEVQYAVEKEFKQFKDIVQANFTDSYYNNTYKTMMGFKWAARYCNNARYYMFVDDDYYVSTKNILRFVRNPVNYPQYLKLSPLANRNHKPLQVLDIDLEEDIRLYTGYVFNSSPHRHYLSKWQVSLSEYPYHMWPPYVTAGAYILSREALNDMFYASFYTKHFRFDDIYVGLLAYKTRIEPFHCEEFNFYKKYYSAEAFEYTIASHGFDNPDYLLKVWTEQRSLGHA